MADDLQAAPSAVERYFFTPLYYPRSPFAVIAWWERRRLAYNVTIGAAGLLSLGAVWLVSNPPPQGPDDFQVLGIVLAYGFAANVCYSLGWMADLLLRRALGIRAPDIGPVMLRYGFVFSLGLTLLPVPIAIFSGVMQLLFNPGH